MYTEFLLEERGVIFGSSSSLKSIEGAADLLRDLTGESPLNEEEEDKEELRLPLFAILGSNGAAGCETIGELAAAKIDAKVGEIFDEVSIFGKYLW